MSNGKGKARFNNIISQAMAKLQQIRAFHKKATDAGAGTHIRTIFNKRK